MLIGVVSILLLFFSVIGFCAGNGFRMGGFLFVLAVVAFIAAMLIGLYKLFTAGKS